MKIEIGTFGIILIVFVVLCIGALLIAVNTDIKERNKEGVMVNER